MNLSLGKLCFFILPRLFYFTKTVTLLYRIPKLHTFMKKKYLLLMVGCILALASCQTLETVRIEYLVPADLNFPTELRQVGVVNNVNLNAPDNHVIEPGDSIRLPYELARKVRYTNANAQLATESLAEAIAEANYFDVVVLCDSALRADDIRARQTTLSQNEVKQLAQELDVDFIIALENAQLKIKNTVYRDELGLFIGAVDVNVHPSVAIYLPGRQSPLAIINAKDSIFWDAAFTTMIRAQIGVKSEDKIIEEASTFAGSVPVKHLVPYWKEASRAYFNTNATNMRDAAYMVQTGEWDEAHRLWQQVYLSKKKKNKLRAAFNIALYYEVTDNLPEAETWATKALELALEVENCKAGANGEIEPDFENKPYVYTTYFYLSKLRNRNALQSKLNMQMQRFDNEFQ